MSKHINPTSTNPSSYYSLTSSTSLKGFTIVELLVVIVIIGILAAITIVSYTGVTSRAVAASLQSDLANASQQLKMFQVENSAYPTANNCPTPGAGEICLKASDSTTYNYTVDNSVNPQTFCLVATKNSQTYTVMHYGTPTEGGRLNYGLALHLDAGNTASYPGSGTTWTDLSTRGNNGNLLNGVSYSGSNGGALVFDGVDDRVNLGKPSAFKFGMNSFSYGLWLNATSNIGSWDMPWYCGGSSDSSNGFDFEFGAGPWSANIGDGVDNKTVAVSASGTIGSWVHVFVVLDRNSNLIKTYVNGQPAYSTSAAGLGSINPSYNSTVGSSASGSSFFNGQISEMRIYDRALSPEEVEDLYSL